MYIYIYIYTHMTVCVCACVCVCMCICVCVCVCDKLGRSAAHFDDTGHMCIGVCMCMYMCVCYLCFLFMCARAISRVTPFSSVTVKMPKKKVKMQRILTEQVF